MNRILIDKIKKYEKVNFNNMYIKEVNIDISLKKIRDYLMTYADIVEEDLENNIYIAYFKSGMLHLNRTLLGFILENKKLTIIGYSRNNITNHNGDKKVVERVANELMLNKRKKVKIKQNL